MAPAGRFFFFFLGGGARPPPPPLVVPPLTKGVAQLGLEGSPMLDSSDQGRIQRLKKGGGTHGDWCGHAARAARIFFPAYKAGQAQRCRGVWEYAPPGKLSILAHMRVLLMPLGTTKTTQNWTVTQAIHRMVVSRSPFLQNKAQNCLLGAAVLSPLCLQDDSYRNMRCVRVATCVKRVVNLRV